MSLEVIAGSNVRSLLLRRQSPTLSPPLKWPGGKRWQIPHLLPFWQSHQHRRLVEPFCGGLAVSLGLSPERALLNDVNPHVVNLYRNIQRGLRITTPLRNSRTNFASYRFRFNKLIASGQAETKEAATLFYFLNRTAFNGLCRFNQQGQFNAPYGQYKRVAHTRDFAAYQPVFGRWDFRCGDFASLPVEPDDFIYADPPYDVEFTQYSQHGFGWNEQVRVAEWLAQHPGPVILSNQATDRIVALYRKLGFKLRFLQAPRRISCNGDRTPAREVLATRNL